MQVEPILFSVDDREEPIGYRLVLGLLFLLGCGLCAGVLGVLAAISWINGWNWIATALFAASTVSAAVGVIAVVGPCVMKRDTLVT